MRQVKLLLLGILFSLSPLLATNQVYKTGTTNFTDDIKAKAFDRYDGTFYIGLVANNDAGYNIASAGRSATTFSKLLNSITDGQGGITTTHLGLLRNSGRDSATSHVAFKSTAHRSGDLKILENSASPSALVAHVLTATLGYARNGDGAVSNICSTFPRAAGYFDRLETNTRHIFLRVYGRKADSSAVGGLTEDTSWTFTDAGILGMLLQSSNATYSLHRIGHGDRRLAVTLDSVLGPISNNGAFLRHGSSSSFLTSTADVTDMHWDEELQTLFICGDVRHELGGAKADYVSAISKVKFMSDGISIHLSDVLPRAINTRVQSTANVEATSIFTVSKNGSISLNDNPRLYKIRVMHTSTNRDYLIVNGGIATTNGDGTRTGNEVYALQYSATSHFLDHTAKAGTVVANNSAKSQLTTNFDRIGADQGPGLDGGNIYSLVIGGETAPWGSHNIASDMEVIGDTVYITTTADKAGNPATENPGIWKSTALFDHDGVIIGWTNWERVFPSKFPGGTDATQNTDQTYFAAIDAKNNKVWQVNGNTRSVQRTGWTTSPSDSTTLAYQVDTSFGSIGGCVCMLDLPLDTPGIKSSASGANVPNVHNSYALFGGYEKVSFARTSSGDQYSTITDFSAATDYLETTLPSGAGAARCLGFSRCVTGSRGYFFAGTDIGLYVYGSDNTTTASGFAASRGSSTGLSALNFRPFDTFAWQRMDASNISSGVSHIDSDGTYLYVVKQDTTSTDAITTELWRYTISNTVAATVATAVKIAASGYDGIPSNTIITGFTLITDNTGMKAEHRGIISTNQGIFESKTYLSGFASVTAGTNAVDAWTNIGNEKAYITMYQFKRVPTYFGNDTDQSTHIGDEELTYDGVAFRAFGSAFADDSNGYGYYQKSTLHQFGFSKVAGNQTGSGHMDYTNKDMDYTAAGAVSTSPLTYVDYIYTFWTDGARRIYARFNSDDMSGSTSEPGDIKSINSLPYSGREWAITAPYPTESSETDTDAFKGYPVYWIENISGLGILMAGTSNGCIALE